MTVTKICVHSFTTLLCLLCLISPFARADAEIERCKKSAKSIEGYLPDKLAKLLPLEAYMCGLEVIHEFVVKDDLKKIYTDLAALNSEKVIPIPTHRYALGNIKNIVNHGSPINLEKENLKVSRALVYLKEHAPEKLKLAIIVPGYSNAKATKATPLDPIAQERVDLGVRVLMGSGAPLIIFSGGNVHPKNTPYNEAYEMKMYAIKRYKIPEEMIAIEPIAKNSVTNIRNSARFLLAHDIKRAVIVTSVSQNFYYKFLTQSAFNDGAKRQLGYSMGAFETQDVNTTLFDPDPVVFTPGKDPQDP